MDCVVRCGQSISLYLHAMIECITKSKTNVQSGQFKNYNFILIYCKQARTFFCNSIRTKASDNTIIDPI